MNKFLKKICAGIMLLAIMAGGFLTLNTATVHAADSLRENACRGVNYAIGNNSADCGKDINIVWSWAFTIINWILIAVGIICVVFIIIGAIKFMTSGGDPEKVKSGKNTILYAIIGLVIAVLAEVIVQIVFSVIDTAII